MYNPSRGGVRGGADQFTWESVKSDKHRENYLGHSLKAPVGRWQKGKDLSWYAKERKDGDNQNKSKNSEFAAIKRAEEEAMLIALGQNVVRKESQPMTKEEMKEALKRNIGERDVLDIERVDGVGAGRRALLSGASSKTSNEGITFETLSKTSDTGKNQDDISLHTKRSKNKKKSKKHKSVKKHKKDRKENSSVDSEVSRSRGKKKQEVSSAKGTESSKRWKRKERTNSCSSESDHHKRCKDKRKEKYRIENTCNLKRRRHDTSESDLYIIRAHLCI